MDLTEAEDIKKRRQEYTEELYKKDLHDTDIYFFLSNLSFVDICFTSTIIPKMLWNIQTQSQVITYEGCITQMYFYIFFAELDDILLTVMAYDRYVAICHPLHYMVIMNLRLCGLLVLISWVLISLYSLLHSLMVLRLSFCPEMQIPHFFCELSQVVQLASSDNFLNNIVIFFFSCSDRCWSFCWHPLLIF